VIHACNPARSGDCEPGPFIDPWDTSEDGETCQQFGGGVESPAIPANFFEEGSDSFVGTACFIGVPLGTTPFGEYGEADTLVERSADPFDRCEPPSTENREVDIEVVALSLESTGPITVTYNGGRILSSGMSRWIFRRSLNRWAR
jgi:hypothetical protein